MSFYHFSTLVQRHIFKGINNIKMTNFFFFLSVDRLSVSSGPVVHIFLFHYITVTMAKKQKQKPILLALTCLPWILKRMCFFRSAGQDPTAKVRPKFKMRQSFDYTWPTPT